MQRVILCVSNHCNLRKQIFGPVVHPKQTWPKDQNPVDPHIYLKNAKILTGGFVHDVEPCVCPEKCLPIYNNAVLGDNLTDVEWSCLQKNHFVDPRFKGEYQHTLNQYDKGGNAFEWDNFNSNIYPDHQ